MADKTNYIKQFTSECNDFDLPVDTHEEAAEGQQPALPCGQTGPNAVRKRPPPPAHGTSGHTSQADGTSNELPLTSSDTDEEQTYRRHSDDDLAHPDDVEHDGPRKQKKRHVLKTKMPKMRKRPRVETEAQADT